VDLPRQSAAVLLQQLGFTVSGAETPDNQLLVESLGLLD